MRIRPTQCASRQRLTTTPAQRCTSSSRVQCQLPVEDIEVDDTVVDEVDADVSDEDLELDDDVPAAVDEPAGSDTVVNNEDTGASNEPTAATTGNPRRTGGRAVRRAAVPKWDDIMFGMKPKDGS